MTDHPIPDDLVNKLAEWDVACTCDPAYRSRELFDPACSFHDFATFLAHGLAEWADGGLIDPSTWTVVEVKPTGWDWCSVARMPLPTLANIDPCSNDAALVVLSPRGGER